LDFWHGIGPLDIVGGPWALDGFFGFGFSREFGGAFCKGSPWSGYLVCICSAILGGLLGKRKVEYMGLQSTFPPFYRTLIEEWYYN
jgi:hypothetical protein